jgi:hypothetical protein
MQLWRSAVLYTVVSLSFLVTSCKMPGEQQDLSKLTDDFVYGSLALSPVSAT